MITFIYKALGEMPEKRVLKVKNPNNRKEKIEVEYLKKHDFKQFREQEEEADRVVAVAAYTRFKPIKDDVEPTEPFLFLNGARFYSTKDKTIIRHIKGYIKVLPINDSADEGNSTSNTTYFLAVTRLTLLPLLLLLLLLPLLFRSCGNNEGNTPVEPTTSIVEKTTEAVVTEKVTMPIDTNIHDWNGDLPSDNDSKPTQEEIELVGYDKITVSAKSPYLNLINPDGNTVYFRYSVRADDKVIFNTELIPPKSYVPCNIYELLMQAGYSSADGEIPLRLVVSTFDIDTQAPCNPATIMIVVIINQ